TLTNEFASLKYDLLKQDHCLEKFHACEDKQAVRDRVFAILSQANDYQVHSIVVRKNRVNPSMLKYGVYSVAYRTMLKYLVGGRQVNNLHIIVDTAPGKKQQASLEEALEKRASEVLRTRKIDY